MIRVVGDRATDRAVAAVRRNWQLRAAGHDEFYRRYGARQREAWKSACERILPRPLKVLDVGTGTGFLAALLAELGHDVTAVDVAPAMLDRARAEVERRGVDVRLRHCGAHDVAVLGETFDLVTARFVVWTLPAPVDALAAWRQVLRPSGAVLVADARWRTVRSELRRLLASVRRDPGYARRLVRDYRMIGRATPHWPGLTAARTARLLRAAGFGPARRFDHLLPAHAHPSGEDFFLLTAPARVPGNP